MQNANKPAFPTGQNQSSTGLSKLEYALIHSAYEPPKDAIEREVTRDRLLNPHNDSYKPKIRSYSEIVKELKIKYFSELLN